MAQPKNVIGENLRKLRTKQGLSQNELAACAQRLGLDITRDTVAKIEGRVRWVGDFEIIVLAKALGVLASDLLPDKMPVDELIRARTK